MFKIFKLGCDKCENWFHYQCIGFIGSESSAQLMKFFCDNC